MTSTFSRWSRLLQDRLAAPLPGTDAQLQLAPDIRLNPEQARVEGKNCREAAVLIAIYPRMGEHVDEEPALILTERPPDLLHHPGQISLPGGRREPGEELRQTALREAHEEISLNPNEVELVTGLTPLFVPPSNFCVFPFVGLIQKEPELQPRSAEVAAILRVPLSALCNESALQVETRTLRGQDVRVPFFAFRSHKIWGATAMILAELVEIEKDVSARL